MRSSEVESQAMDYDTGTNDPYIQEGTRLMKRLFEATKRLKKAEKELVEKDKELMRAEGKHDRKLDEFEYVEGRWLNQQALRPQKWYEQYWWTKLKEESGELKKAQDAYYRAIVEQDHAEQEVRDAAKEEEEAWEDWSYFEI